ncbi:glycine hydroxymethyltransferase [Salvia divinorum]|uniref:Glycine hydroxymethyltransferase n=1 Tax=Salvia divinorum TaxID=28513 RepID=A0ABD1H5G1_SALDI
MDGEGPLLFASKPRKSKLKASLARPPPPPRLPQRPKGFFRSRYRVIVPLLLALNFSIGAYVLVKTTLRDRRISEEKVPDELTSSRSEEKVPEDLTSSRSTSTGKS